MNEDFDRRTLGHEAAQLLDALRLYSDERGRAQAPVSTLLRKAGLTQGGLMRARAGLIRQGLLHVETGYMANGLPGPHVYVLDSRAAGGNSESSKGESGQGGATWGPATPPPAAESIRTPSRSRHAKRGRFLSAVRRGLSFP